MDEIWCKVQALEFARRADQDFAPGGFFFLNFTRSEPPVLRPFPFKEYSPSRKGPEGGRGPSSMDEINQKAGGFAGQE